MKKVYRLLFLVSFVLLIGLIIFFILRVNPKIKTKIYVDYNDYWVALNTNELNNKKSTININNKDYKVDFSLAYNQDNWNIYYLSIYDLETKLSNNTDAFIYLQSISLIKYLTNK